MPRRSRIHRTCTTFDLDEGAFLEATRELIDGGHWAATTLDGEPRYDKPILSYWPRQSRSRFLDG